MGGVILGMPGPWAENFLEKSDHYTTKIGGLPDWPIPDMFIEPDLIKCVLCGERLCLLAQVYAPIEMAKLNVDERVLYVFGCLKPKCGSSWRALRVQKCNSEKPFNGIRQDSKPSTNCNGKGKNLGRGSCECAEENLVSDNGESVEETYDDLGFDELARELSEVSSQASQSKKQKGSLIFEATKKSMQSKPLLNGLISSIPVVPCFYIYPQEDGSFGEVAAVCANYSALSIKQEVDSSNDKKEEEVWEGEGYEYDKALGADRTFMKFKKRIDAYPEQCFRYSHGGKPLLAKTDLAEPNPCNLCGSPRQYELQLMPPLLYFLHEAADGSSAYKPEEWNWMTLLVYTCSSDKLQNKIGKGNKRGDLYYLHTPEVYINNVTSDVWHYRFGHTSRKEISKIKTSHENHCQICPLAKQKRLPFISNNHMSEFAFDLIHADIWGPFSITCHNGYNYFLTLVDDSTRFTWIYLLKNKSDISHIIPLFFNLIHTQYGTKIKQFRTDNAKEFNLHFFKEMGILHQLSCIYRPEQNSVVERKHQHILNVARALLFQSCLPLELWSECILTAVYLINRTPSTLLKDKSPYDLLYLKDFDYNRLKVFGCLAYASTPVVHRHKFEPRAKAYVFIGYPPNIKGYKLYDIEEKKVVISRDVVFYESIFPFKHSIIPKENIDFFADIVLPITNDTNFDIHENIENVNEDTNRDFLENIEDTNDEGANDNNIGNNVGTSTRHSNRNTRCPTYLKDYNCNLNSLICSKEENKRTSFGNKRTLLYPICNFISYNKLSEGYKKAIICMSSHYEPKNFNEASNHPCWLKAMKDELKSLEENKTWHIIELPQNKNCIGCRWTYKLKLNSDGTINKHKARLVAKGYTQKEGIDFGETFSPVAKMTTIRVILAVAASNNWHLHQLDINNAFLNGDLQEEVYMDIPLGINDDNCYHNNGKRMVCKLDKSIYGLKQSSRQWYSKFSTTLTNNGFIQSKADYTLFYKGKDSSFVALIVYVDDIIIASSSISVINSTKLLLNTYFKLTDLGNLKFFLGLEISKSNEGIFLCQRHYTLQLLEECGMLGCKPSRCPMDTNIKLNENDGDLIPDPLEYRRLIGKLLYLTLTRPDITFATHRLSQFISKPRFPHLSAAKHLIRYLKSAPGRGILFSSSSKHLLTAFSDADWGSCPDTRRSVTGLCTFLGNTMISWKAKKQNTVSRSSVEAEYRALAATTSEITWIKELLKDLQINIPLPIQIYCDNLAAIHIATNPVFHERTKHIELDLHFIRDKIREGTIKLMPINTKLQLADLFTKALPYSNIQRLIIKMGIKDLYFPS